MREQTRGQAVSLMLVGTFLFWFSLYTYPSFLTVYAKELGAAPVLVGMIAGSYGLLQMLLRIPAGIYSDMIKKHRPFILGGMCVSLISAIGFSLIKSPVGLLISRGLAGVAATTWVNYSVLYSSLFDDSELTGAMGRIWAVQSASQLVALTLGGYLSKEMGYTSAFILAASASAIGLLCMLAVKDRPTNTPPRTLKALISAMKNKSLLISTGLSAVFHFVCWGTILGFTANWARDVVNMDNAELGLLSAMYLVPNLIVSPFIGKVTAKLGMRKTVALCFLLEGAACFLFSRCYTPIMLYGAQMLFGLGMAPMMPLFLSGAISDVNPTERGAAMGFYQSLYGIGMFLGPLFSGFLIQRFSGSGIVHGYAANFYAMAAVSAIGMLLAIILYRRKSS